MTIDLVGEMKKTNAAGQVKYSLPNGQYAYSVLTYGNPEIIYNGEQALEIFRQENPPLFCKYPVWHCL